MKIDEVKEFLAKCPHCKQNINSLNAMTHGSIIQHYIYCCPKCDCIISCGINSFIGIG